jgi:hypothetical protein
VAERPPKTDSPYNLDPAFERAAVTLCCRSSRFWGRIGHHLEPDALSLEPAKHALKAVRAVARDLGRGPDSVLLVLQRLRRWVDEGKHTIAHVTAVAELFEEAEEDGLPREDDAVAELAPILKRRMRAEAARSVMEEFAKEGTFQRTRKLIDEANNLGDVDTTVGVQLGAGSYDEIARVRDLEKLPLGIDDLDTELSCLGIVLGGPGAGKSMTLSHIGGSCIKQGLFAAYATLEVPVPDVLARVKAYLTGEPISAILDNPESVRRRLEAMKLGPFFVNEFTPLSTTMDDLERWVTELEEHVGRKLDVLLTDYGDKLGAPKSAGKEAEHGYSSGRIVFERMRIFAHERKMWHWTGSQATRGKDKRKKLGLDDVADSMHKVRVADLVISANAEEDGETITWFVAKNRHGKGQFAVGPLPHDFACGRVAPVVEW